MSFNILYVENRQKDWELVYAAVERHNASSRDEERLHIEWARNPEELNSKLELHFDAILADVYYDDLKAEMVSDIDDRLDEIISYVDRWRLRQPFDRSLPIIAYTGLGSEALRSCLRRRHKLYDIWDKNTALPEYISWRLSRLAIEVSRGRPDAKMQELIAEMPSAATWHEHVVDMAHRYDSGWTERDQIERAGEEIGHIAYAIGVWNECEPMWEAIKSWEWLGRAVSPRVRGHARHVINVFWLGYYLLNSRQLSPIFKNLWHSGVVARRRSMEAVARLGAAEGLSNVWFLAGLFHDAAGSVEKAQAVADAQASIVKIFWRSSIDLPRPWPGLMELFKDDLISTIEEFESPLREVVRSVMERGLEHGAIDHGLLAGMHIRRVIRGQKEACFAREAARAMALHNMFPEFPEEIAHEVSWENEPIACLLLLCDQIQTWDRERNDTALKDEDRPQRAELAGLSIQKKGGKTHINFRINYIVPSHVLRSPEIYGRVRDELERILKDKPGRALQKIGGTWPFSATVESALSGKALKTLMKLGG